MRRLLILCALVALICASIGAAAAQDPSQRHLPLKQLMLELINDARRAAGAPEVRLGTNAAAQLHAEQMVAECFHSHWGRDGLKPYMRYSLLGGYQNNAENVAEQNVWPRGGNPCAARASAESPDLEQLVRNAMAGWLNSSGHRRTLLDPSHRLVNIGIAWRGSEHYIFRAVQHFEGDYVRLNAPVSLAAGVLTLSGRIVNGASLQTGLIVYHDPQPQPQSRASLALTSAYCGGYPVAAVLPSANWTYRSTTPDCVEPALAGPRADGGWIDLSVIAADRWQVEGAEFSIRADLSSALRRFGAGVYTIVLAGEVDEQRTELLKYALFYGLWPLNRAWTYSSGPITAPALIERLDLEVVFYWDGASWRGYAASGGAPIPGAADFTVEAGDWLWLSSAR